MSQIPQIPFVDKARTTPDIAETFADICRVYGIPSTPPLYQSMANAPSVLFGSWKLNVGIMNHGELPDALKQLIFLAVSAARKCQYCELVFSALCKVTGTPDDQIRAAIEDLSNLSPERTRAIIQFAIKAAVHNRSLEDADYDRLREQGLSNVEILEVIAVAGTATYFNILAGGMKVEIDDTIRSILDG